MGIEILPLIFILLINLAGFGFYDFNMISIVVDKGENGQTEFAPLYRCVN